MNVIPLLSVSAETDATSVRRVRRFQRVASRCELSVSSVLGIFGLFAVRRVWLAVLAPCFARVRYARRVRRVLCIRFARAVDVFRPFGVFGLIGAFDAINLLGVLNAFEMFVVYSARSACLVRLVRFALVRSTSWVYFCCCRAQSALFGLVFTSALLSVLVLPLTLPLVVMLTSRRFLPAELILARALTFFFVLVAWSCCGMDCAVACARNSRMLMAFIKNANRVIAKRRQDCTHIGKSQTVCKFESYFRCPQPLQRCGSMLAAIRFLIRYSISGVTVALDTLRRSGCPARARAHGCVCVVMPMHISDAFRVHVFAVLVQLPCRGCEARCATRLAVGRNGEFALLRHSQSYGFERKPRTVRGEVLTLIWYQKLVSKLGPFSEPKIHKTCKTETMKLQLQTQRRIFERAASFTESIQGETERSSTHRWA